MKTDLEKCKYVVACLNLDIVIHTRENEIELLAYDYDGYLGSVYFNLDGSLIDISR